MLARRESLNTQAMVDAQVRFAQMQESLRKMNGEAPKQTEVLPYSQLLPSRHKQRPTTFGESAQSL